MIEIHDADDEVNTIAFTGHRYVMEDEMAAALGEVAKRFKNAVWICGGAIGVDSYAARYAMVHHIPYRLILPFAPEVMSKYWSDAQKKLLQDTIAHAMDVQVLSPVYDVKYYQLRNIAMVDAAQVLIAFFDGTSGGTANCVRYAKFKRYNIVQYPGPYRGTGRIRL